MEVMERFLKRGTRPITMMATALGGGYLALSYLQSKLNGMHDSLTRTRVSTENLRRRFEQNQQDCAFTVLALIPTLGKQVVESMNVERLVEVLNQTKSKSKPITTSHSEKENSNKTDSQLTIEDLKPETQEQPSQSMDLASSSSELNALVGSTSSEKSNLATTPQSGPIDPIMQLLRPDGTVLQKRSEIWTEMMLVTFSRLFTCLYGLTLLTLQTHIQLGLLGRDLYLSSLMSTESLDDDEGLEDRLLILPEKSAHDITIERQYLTFSWWYLHKGWIILSNRIRNVVEQVLSSRSLKDTISLSDLQQIFNSIRKKVEFESDGTDYIFASILLPSTTTDEIQTLELGGMPPQDCQVDARLRTLLDETQDFINCPDFQLVLSRAMDRIMDLCISNIGSNSTALKSEQEASTCFPIDLSTSLPLPRFTQLENNSPKTIVEANKKSTVRLVEVLPVISKESLDILNVIPNIYVETISETTELKEFSSVIYTTFDGLTNSI